MNITNQEKMQVRQLLQSPQWQVFERLSDMLCDQIAYDPKLKPTEWETAKTVAYDQGRVDGIKDLIKELYTLARE